MLFVKGGEIEIVGFVFERYYIYIYSIYIYIVYIYDFFNRVIFVCCFLGSDGGLGVIKY